jgi:deoxyribonuclease V
MILALDTYYESGSAKTVCIMFNDWADALPAHELSEFLDSVADYEPGAFYKRELPCILSLLSKITLCEGDSIVVDGYVYLDDAGKLGLGGHLYEHLNRKFAVIGVAKTNFATNNTNKREIRGESEKPLYVTAIGIEVDEVAKNVRRMHGEYRIPTLLKLLDQRTREK